MSDRQTTGTGRRGPARRTPRPAAEADRGRRPGPGRGPFGGMGMPAEKSMNFGPSARRLVGRLAPERGAGRRGGRCSPSSASSLTVIGPKILGHATDLIFAGVIGRQLPAGHHARSRPSQALRAAGDGNFADMLARMDVVPGQGIDFAALGARAAAGRSALYVAASLLGVAAGLPAQRRRAAHRLPAARATSRTSSTGCRCATSTGSRAASCSAGSPTTSTTSRRPCSRR